MRSGKSAEIRNDLKENLLGCDALVIIYGKTTVTWVRQQLLYCRKTIYAREQPLHAFAVYEGPPAPKEPLDLKLPSMQIIDCCSGLNEEKLKSFLDSIQQERNP
jgi:hypothetical protein